LLSTKATEIGGVARIVLVLRVSSAGKFPSDPRILLDLTMEII